MYVSLYIYMYMYLGGPVLKKKEAHLVDMTMLLLESKSEFVGHIGLLEPLVDSSCSLSEQMGACWQRLDVGD